MKIAVAAGLVLTATSVSLAQDFNPGTVVGNVLQNPASGCGYGFGYTGPDCGGPSRHDRGHQARGSKRLRTPHSPSRG